MRAARVLGRNFGRAAGQTLGLAATASLALSQPLAAQQAADAAAEASANDADDLSGLYVPQDEDERGLWMRVDEMERDRKNSPLVIEDEELNTYVRGVLCRTVGEAKCANIRLYIVRTPYFNAMMAPNGMMEVWSGLLLRVENEAQLAAVLAHEYAHFEERHSVRLFRDAKRKSNAASFLSLIPFGGLVGLGLMTSIFGFSREMERESDARSIEYLANAGYDTSEVAVIWQRLREEMDRTAEERGTRSRKDKNGGLFASHPPTAERVENLTEAAAANPGAAGVDGEAEFRAAMAFYWPQFVDDQLKMNDFGASEFLLESLARDGWDESLLYAHGELYRTRGGEGDFPRAQEIYTQAIDGGGARAELWRGRGLVLLKQGQTEAGQADLQEYVRRAPYAEDAAMIGLMAGVPQ